MSEAVKWVGFIQATISWLLISTSVVLFCIGHPVEAASAAIISYVLKEWSKEYEYE